MAPHVPLGLRPARAMPMPGQRLGEARLEHAGSLVGYGVGMFSDGNSSDNIFETQQLNGCAPGPLWPRMYHSD
ncbi:MAG: hypothetical protein OEW40_17630, partial [Cyclobacteriaceae bacterium]|nr:hypothetical protein [Cyclobacteriaceae bacterium]